MIQVEIFNKSTPEQLESEVNIWLRDAQSGALTAIKRSEFKIISVIVDDNGKKAVVTYEGYDHMGGTE